MTTASLVTKHEDVTQYQHSLLSKPGEGVSDNHPWESIQTYIITQSVEDSVGFVPKHEKQKETLDEKSQGSNHHTAKGNQGPTTKYVM